MSIAAARRILWLAAVFVVPLPFFLVETGLVPAARVLMLAAVTVAVIITEGSLGAVGIAAALLIGQGLLYLAILWMLTGLLLRPLRRRSSRTVAVITATLVVVAIVCASMFEIYHTPFRTESLQASLLEVYE
jgi:hypothetical protein